MTGSQGRALADFSLNANKVINGGQRITKGSVIHGLWSIAPEAGGEGQKEKALLLTKKQGKQRDDRIRKMFIVRKGIITKPNKDDPDAEITGSDILGKGRVLKPHLTPQVTCGFLRGGAALQGGSSHWH